MLSPYVFRRLLITRCPQNGSAICLEGMIDNILYLLVEWQVFSGIIIPFCCNSLSGDSQFDRMSIQLTSHNVIAVCYQYLNWIDRILEDRDHEESNSAKFGEIYICSHRIRFVLWLLSLQFETCFPSFVASRFLRG